MRALLIGNITPHGCGRLSTFQKTTTLPSYNRNAATLTVSNTFS